METVNYPELLTRPRTVKEEFQYLEYVLNKLPFYEKHGYRVSLPELNEFRHPIEPQLRDKAFADFLRKEYREDFYTKGLEVLKQSEETIKSGFPTFMKLNKAWGFKVFPKYTVKLTKYGPGGSYDVNSASIIMLTTAEGGFGRSDPAHTVIHECVHIGIEEVIVEKFNLTHPEKESLVDLICEKLFKGVLKEYEIQSFGDTKINKFITSEVAVYDLPTHITRFVAENPR